MSEQDELVQVIENTGGFMFGEPFYDPPEVANAILAAGYRKPRTITTEDELDALPVETIVMEHACNDPIQRYSSGWQFGGDAVKVSLPATVVWTPEA